MRVFHISAECYPVAKTGGLGDVVAALPKYQNILGLNTAVIMPWYDKPFVSANKFKKVYESEFKQGSQYYPFAVFKEENDLLGFELYLIKIPGLLDRADVYGYPDESDQFIAFQHALLHWISKEDIAPDVFHCHDHHSGLIPFFIENCAEFHSLKGTPTLATIHNGQYQGWMDWHKAILMPAFDSGQWGLLDWNKLINPLAALIKCCWAYNAVSKGYLQELFVEANGLQSLFLAEKKKGFGIINGIDTDIWNPETDTFINQNYRISNMVSGKVKNKKALCEAYGLDHKLPLLAFIGRFAMEKGADLLPAFIQELLLKFKGKISFLILGSGDPQIQEALTHLKENSIENIAIVIGYNEKLSHQIYASADFLIMPSRVEPCGLNQLYAMKYGTVPVVRSIGGLKDTVHDLSKKDPNGIAFKDVALKDMVQAVQRSINIYEDSDAFRKLQKKNMNLDYSWEKSANEYIQLYESIISKRLELENG